MHYFVREDSIVRRIWGRGDTILFIFAGSAAEFALNKAVDWLYFTGRLPADPLGRLFSTVDYARMIIFSTEEDALKAIDTITAIHQGVENKRGASIPDWAYRDVLYMLIDYSIRSGELLEKKLSRAEKEEVFNVFYRVGDRMGLKELPDSYQSWLLSREEHIHNDLQKSHYTADLFKQYKKHLGYIRYKLLIQAQLLVVPSSIAKMLNLGKFSLLWPAVTPYKLARRFNMEWIIKKALLPGKYSEEIKALDR